MSLRPGLALSMLIGALACERAQEDPSPKSEPAAVPEADKLTPATTPEAVIAKPSGPAPVVPHGFAVVRPGAQLRIDPLASQPSLELPSLAAGQSGGYLFTASGRNGELVTLETARTGSGCERTLWPLTKFRLVLYAAEADLVNVTTRRLDIAFADGTRVVVLPGATVLRDGNDGEVDAGGLALRLSVPVDAAGRFYEPDEVGFAARARRPMSEGGEPLRYGEGHAIADESRLESDFIDGRRVPVAFDTRERDGKTLVEVRNACAAITAATASERLVAPFASAGILGMIGSSSGGAGLIGVLGAGPTETVYEVKPGAAISWEDGRAAGQVAADHRFDRPPIESSGRSCFTLEVEKDSLLLCFAASDVQRVERVAAGGLGAFADAEAFGGLTGSEIGEGGFGLAKRSPKVKLGTEPEVKGALDQSAVRKTVRSQMKRIRSCYDKELIAEPELAGKLTMQFVIGEEGAVVMAVVGEDTMGSKAVADCVTRALHSMKFPAPKSGVVTVIYPITFAPS